MGCGGSGAGDNDFSRRCRRTDGSFRPRVGHSHSRRRSGRCRFFCFRSGRPRGHRDRCGHLRVRWRRVRTGRRHDHGLALACCDEEADVAVGSAQSAAAISSTASRTPSSMTAASSIWVCRWASSSPSRWKSTSRRLGTSILRCSSNGTPQLADRHIELPDAAGASIRSGNKRMTMIKVDTISHRTRSCSLASGAVWRASKACRGSMRTGFRQALPASRAHRMEKRRGTMSKGCVVRSGPGRRDGCRHRPGRTTDPVGRPDGSGHSRRERSCDLSSVDQEHQRH